MHVEIRPLAKADAEGLLPLLDVLGYGTDRDHAVSRVARLVDHADCAGWVAVASEPVGFATGQLSWMVQADEPVAELTALVVMPAWSGSGVGSRLLAVFEAWAVEAGASRLKVTSGGHRLDAHRFYERRGYARSGVRFHKTLHSDERAG